MNPFSDHRLPRVSSVFAIGMLTAVCLAGGVETNAPAPSAADGKTNLWSLRPIVRPKVPTIANHGPKARNPIDRFIDARLAADHLTRSPEAPKRVLIRRLYFDLTGLPPAPEEVAAFERDSAPDAYEKLVERLLASPRYGERWAQHWLDVVRFAESHGFEMNQPRPNAWRYRDYVINAFNQDKPYNRFVVEQFAGDVVGEDAATGFLVAGPWDQVKSPDPVLTAAQRADELHDMVSTTGSAFLGLTVGCARCHNHKFDPIPQTDYYAIKACLQGVQHGERKMRTPDLLAKEAAAGDLRRELAALENSLTQFEPLATLGRRIEIEPEPMFGSQAVEQLKPASLLKYAAGSGRGEREDPGDLGRLPTSTRSFIAWTNFPATDVFAWAPAVEGRFRLRLSWGCGFDSHAPDARFILDRDGDLSTTNDQVEIARVDQRRFADGSTPAKAERLWSGFYDAGAWSLSRSNRIVLRGGSGPGVVTAGVLGLVEEPAAPAPERVVVAGSGGSGSSAAVTEARLTPPASASETGRFQRMPVSPRRNVDRFEPVPARRLRFTIDRTTDAEPCIDELEVYTSSNPTNLALASAGTVARASSVYPNSELHRLEHLNDGKYGNSHSWISNERGKGWVELEFPQTVTIDRVVWGRDREQQFADRLAVEYRIEVSVTTNDWRLVATSGDRVPYAAGRTSAPVVSFPGLSPAAETRVKELLARRAQLEATMRELTTLPMAYAGMLTTNPETTYRLQRGDAMQKREPVQPGVLTAISLPFRCATNGLTDDQQRRFALASWIVDPANPLPARVLVNRLWQHHFGEGLVATPSDFGHKGIPPSHPELLDWLAAEFMTPTQPSGRAETNLVPWSIKHLHRLMVTSATYRQAGAARPEAIAIDAGSRLLWRFPPQRLEAEALHDTILAVTGTLRLDMGGPGFSSFEPNDNYVRVFNPRKVYSTNEWRRMVYETKVRMHPDSTFGAFDCPDGGQIAPKRIRSTTPLQALNLMNGQFLLQQAGLFARRLEREAGANPPAQVRRAFELAFNRPPSAAEARAAQALIEKNGLALFCRALFNSNEFIFVD